MTYENESDRKARAQEILNTIKSESKEQTNEQRLKNIESILNTIRIQNIKIWEKINGGK